MESKTRRIWNHVFYPPNFLGNQCRILNPTPLSVIYMYQDYADLHHSADVFSLSSKRNHIPQDNLSLKKIAKLTNIFEKANYYGYSEEDEESYDDQYHGRTHSILYEKYGPYTCPKCEGVFDTSQNFAAHMLSHYKSETNKKRVKRLLTRNKRKYRNLIASFKRSKQRMELVAVE